MNIVKLGSIQNINDVLQFRLLKSFDLISPSVCFQNCLFLDPLKRMTCQQLLEHQYFSSYWDGAAGVNNMDYDKSKERKRNKDNKEKRNAIHVSTRSFKFGGCVLLCI